MTQPGFQVDSLRVEPGSGQTLTISRDNTTGSLRFVDNVVPAGLNLVQLSGLSTVAGVLVVGTAGSGAQYTSLQAAHDAVPVTASLTNPYLVLVMGGVYTASLNITKAGITFQALGRVVIQPSAAVPCITVQGAVSSTPTSLTLRGLTLIQTGNGLACLSLQGGATSTVGSEGIIVDGCTLLPTGVGGFTVDAQAVNYVTLLNCQTQGVPVSASMRVQQCAGLTVVGGTIPAAQMDYDTTGAIPSVAGSSYALSGCVSVGNIQSTLQGAGSLAVQTTVTGNVTMNGNRTLSVQGSSVGNLVLNGTTAATLTNSTRGTVAGTGTLSETQSSGTKAFAASATETVTFDVARPNANYTVTLDTGVVTSVYAINKSVAGFDIVFSGPVTTTVRWTVLQ